jgi:hypothetical protein
MDVQWIAAMIVGAGLVSGAAMGQSRSVFRCEQDGQQIFSDRPCAPSATLQPLDAPANVYEAPVFRDTPVPAPRTRPKASADTDPAADLERRRQTCERLALSLRETRSKLRAGYKPSQGEKLKDRQARLKAQMRIARCG